VLAALSVSTLVVLAFVGSTFVLGSPSATTVTITSTNLATTTIPGTSTTTRTATETTTSTATTIMTATTTTTATVTTTSTVTMNLLWSSNFDTGDFSQWNAASPNDPNGGALASITSTLAHTGTYSSYYYYLGAPNGQTKRAYPSENLSSVGVTPSKFEVDMWIYVPSTINGTPVDLTDWISFLSVWVNPGAWNYAYPITIDGNYQGVNLSSPQLHMSIEMLGVDATEYAPTAWPLNQWWELTLVGSIVPNPGTSHLTVYQDGTKMLSWSGVMPTTGSYGEPVTYNGLSYLHAGLYAGPDQGTYAIYNDDIAVYSVS